MSLFHTATGLLNSCLLASLVILIFVFIIYILLCRYGGGASPGGGDRPGGKRDLPTIDEDEDEAWTAPVPKRYSTDKEYGIPL